MFETNTDSILKSFVKTIDKLVALNVQKTEEAKELQTKLDGAKAEALKAGKAAAKLRTLFE